MDHWKIPYTLRLPFRLGVVRDHPYLQASSASLGGHKLEAHVLDDGGKKLFRVHLDESLIYEDGDIMPAPDWFQLCREGGYRPRIHWDKDPVTILFREVLPAMTTSWTGIELPYEEGGFPEGVVSLVTLQDAHEAFRSRLPDTPNGSAASHVAAMFARVRLRAVVLHDRPEQRVDYLGNSLDESYLGIDLMFGGSRGTAARLSKVSLASTGGMRWSPWLPGGHWANDGREFGATQGASDFMRASGVVMEINADFNEAFNDLVTAYAAAMDPVVESYRAAYPVGIPWNHDLFNQYLNHPVVKAEMSGDDLMLTFDNGLKALAAWSGRLTAIENSPRTNDPTQARLLE